MLERSLNVLEAIAGSGQPLSLPELSVLLGVPKTTVFRLAQRLEKSGYLVREPGGAGYCVGPKLVRLSLNALRSAGPNAEWRAILESLVAVLGETCNFTTLAGSEVLYLDRVETRWPLRLHLEPGSRVPLHCTASGKLLLAHMPADKRRKLLETLPLRAETPSTITSIARLQEECETIARRGYSTDNEEFLVGLIAVAVPIVNASGDVVAAVACHALSARMPLKEAVTKLPILREAARKLGATLPQ